ncbi:MAG: hypothetical protein ABJC79_07065 [Acidimicrobiia bacterium]
MDQTHTLNLAPAATNHEGLIARHIARHALMVAPAVLLLAAVLRGRDGALSAAIGLGLCAANFLLSAQILSWAATRGVGAIYGAILGGFVLRLALLTGIVLALKPVSFIDIPVLVLTLAIAHIALLAWETRYVSLTLAAPGLKPGVGEPSKDKE